MEVEEVVGVVGVEVVREELEVVVMILDVDVDVDVLLLEDFWEVDEVFEAVVGVEEEDVEAMDVLLGEAEVTAAEAVAVL